MFSYERLEEWRNFWIPIYRNQVLIAKINDKIDALLEIKENIWENIHLDKKDKILIFKELGIYYLYGKEVKENVI